MKHLKFKFYKHYLCLDFRIPALIVLLCSLIACHKKATVPVILTQEELRMQKFVPAKVVLQSELAGCTYLLALEDGKMLEPVNLHDTLKQNNLRLWVKYQVEKSAMSVCMVGKMVRIDTVKYLR